MKKKSVIAVFAAITVVFSMIFTACSDDKANSGTVTEYNEQTSAGTPSSASPEFTVDSNGNAELPSEANGETASENALLTEPASASQTVNLETTAEIVAYFNTAANKVKTDAVKVVKNYEKRSIGELVVPDVLQSTAESLLPTLIKDDTEPIVYDTKEDIKTNFIVPNQSYVSRLTANDVVKATCVDNGKEYEIYFKLKDEKNPVSGKGVGSVCDVIEARDVAEKAPSFVKSFETEYKNCEVRATIDKATGRMIHATYSTPVALNVTVDLFGTHDVTANFTYIKDYTITY